MAFYILYIIISSILVLAVSSKKIEIRTFFWYLVFLTSFLFSGLRYQIGTDYSSYNKVFDNLSLNDVAFLEFGNYSLMYLIKLGNGSYQIYILLTSFIICFSFFRFINVFSKNKTISLFVFLFFGLFFLSSLNFIRQFLAISFFILAICSLVENNKIKTIFFIIISILFHTSAIVTLPFFLVYKVHVKFKHVIGTICVSMISLKYFNTLLQNTNYGIYLERVSTINNNIPSAFLFLALILSSSFFIIHILSLSQRSFSDNFTLVLLTFSVCCLMPIILFKDLPYNIFLRTNNFFMVSYILVIPSWIASFKSLYFKILFGFLVYIILLSYFIRTAIILGPKYNLYPYKTIFDF